jgi:hypothetical protein
MEIVLSCLHLQRRREHSERMQKSVNIHKITRPQFLKGKKKIVTVPGVTVWNLKICVIPYCYRSMPHTQSWRVGEQEIYARIVWRYFFLNDHFITREDTERIILKWTVRKYIIRLWIQLNKYGGRLQYRVSVLAVVTILNMVSENWLHEISQLSGYDALTRHALLCIVVGHVCFKLRCCRYP